MSKKSYGIALCFNDEKTKEFRVLCIKKSYTYNFCTFVKNPLNYNTPQKFRQILNGTTIHEKRLLLSQNFGNIYDHVFYHRSTQFEKYNNLFKKLCTNQKLKYKKLIMTSGSAEQHWEIPKGKKEKSETILQTAIREFKHETGIDNEDYVILKPEDPPIVYNFVADDGKNYTYYYYIAQCIDGELLKKKLYSKLKFSTQFEESEVNTIKFISISELKFTYSPKMHTDRLMNLLNILKKKYKKNKIDIEKFKQLV